MTDEQLLREKGYNAGAACYALTQIAAGNGTLDQWAFSALNLRRLAELNATYADFAPPSAALADAAATTTTLRVVVRPNGAFANYLAYGIVATDGTFTRHGYPKDVLTPRYGDSWGTRGGAQYEYEVAFDVPAAFPFHIVKVYNQSAVQHTSVEILYTPVQEAS